MDWRAGRTERRWWLAAVVAVAVLAVGCSSPDLPQADVEDVDEAVASEPAQQRVEATPTPTPTPTPRATPQPTPTPTPEPEEAEPTPTPTPIPDGIDEATMRIGVIADLNTGDVVPESTSVIETMEAWTAKVNSTGGLAGRDVELVVYDTEVFSHSDAIERACADGVFALVGSTGLQDGDGVELLDSSACGIPDFPALAVNPSRRASSVTFQSNPIANDVWLAGGARELAERFPEAAASVATPLVQFTPDVINGERAIEAATEQGYVFDYVQNVPFDTDYVEASSAILDLGVQAVAWAADGDRLLLMLEELDEQGAALEFVECGLECYSTAWLEAAGELSSDVWVSVAMLPVDELDVPEIAQFRFWFGSTNPGAEPDGLSVRTWASALLFEEAVRIALEDTTAEDLTREDVLAAARTITEWDANGIHGAANPADAVPSNCFVLLRAENGAWARAHPDGPGTLDCDEANIVTLEKTGQLGLDDEA